jgi:DnaJ-class molecular chaperone
MRLAETLYDLLGVPPAASPTMIKTAYYKLARELAPRLAGDGGSDRWKEIALAYGTLKSDKLRSQYHSRLILEKALNCAACRGTGIRSRFEKSVYVENARCDACSGRGHL